MFLYKLTDLDHFTSDMIYRFFTAYTFTPTYMI